MCETAINTEDVFVSRAVSWQPIWVAMVLASAQIIVFLLVWECGRRNKYVGTNYDKRRLSTPERTPPPLMQHRGWLNGWLGFEWWRLKLTPEYYAISEEEYKERPHETIRDVVAYADEFAIKADAICQEKQEGMVEKMGPLVVDITDDSEVEPELQQNDSHTDGDETQASLYEEDVVMPLDAGSNGSNATEQDYTSTRYAETVEEPSPQESLSTTPPLTLNVTHDEQEDDDDLRVLPKRRRSTRFFGEVFSPDEEDLNRSGDLSQRPDFACRPGTWDRELAKTTQQVAWKMSSTVTDFVNRHVIMMNPVDQDECDEESVASMEKKGISAKKKSKLLLVRKVQRRPLTTEQQELLRCVGLDAFVTLRFLKFGFDISFWPLLLACVVLIPTYKTADKSEAGYFTATIDNLPDGSPRFWAVVGFCFVWYSLVLRRMWIEWEIFLPLRYDFLENGDFEREKYQYQYRNTCLIEYVPRSHKLDKDLYNFFEVLFPGQVRRAEVLLNTEYLTKLIKKRQSHIEAYEDVYAKKVHRNAKYLREVDTVQKHGYIKGCCRGQITRPKEPKEPTIVVFHEITEERRLVNFHLTHSVVKDPRTHYALPYHYQQIQHLNEWADEEFFQLAEERQRPIQEKRESTLARWLGLKYVTGSDSGRLHSTTAFVEFRTLTAKQQAIQCNITGTNKFMIVSPAPGLHEIIWDNAHVPRDLIEARKAWTNLVLFGFIIVWSIFVAFIRSRGNISQQLFNVECGSALQAFLDTYIPVLILEGLVRLIPFVLKFLAYLVRFKAISEIDNYILRWYFGYRMVTFIFVIIGGSLVDSAGEFFDDPIGFVESLSDQVPQQSQYFISYAIIATMGSFFFMSQTHNVLLFLFTKYITTEEAVSSRKLQRMKSSIKTFHSQELIPLFLFVAMIGLLYGAFVPISNAFVAIYFKVAYKVFKYMACYIYGKTYEGGGVRFYMLNRIIFLILYLMILLTSGYLSLYGSGAMTGVMLVMMVVTAVVQVGVWGTFGEPSRTLALTKARESDTGRELKFGKEKKFGALEDHENAKMAPQDLEAMEDSENDEDEPLLQQAEVNKTDGEKRRDALEKVRKRYEGMDSWHTASSSRNFFVYRQPSLNRETWEYAPRPYREAQTSQLNDHKKFEVTAEQEMHFRIIGRRDQA